MLTKAPRGTFDILPEKAGYWQRIERTIRDICRTYRYGEIRTPVFEHTELFERGVGGTTDVVQKEMYTFLDKGERSVTLRPEGTAGVVRAFLENNLHALSMPQKFYYIISCYRYEKPQAGRLREFHQFGAECIGSQGPSSDAELIALARRVLTSLGIEKLRLNINSIGCKDCRVAYNAALKAFARERYDGLCETCRGRLEKNPLRILDCKSPVCGRLMEGAPALLDYICGDCKDHFEALKKTLSEMGIPFHIDTSIVRGLDYYTKTVFEYKTELEGTQGTVCGGGRYDGLVGELGGAPTPAIGFAMGMERILLAMEKANALGESEEKTDLFIANIGAGTEDFVSALADKLRALGAAVEREHMGRSLKAQMKYADKINAGYSMVIGEDEMKTQTARLKNMKTGETLEADLKNLDKIIAIFALED